MYRNYSYVFAEFSTVDEANIAIAAVHGTHFDKSHALFANRFTDIERFANLDEAYVEPEIEEYAPKVRLSHIGVYESLIRAPSSGALAIVACRPPRA